MSLLKQESFPGCLSAYVFCCLEPWGTPPGFQHKAQATNTMQQALHGVWSSTVPLPLSPWPCPDIYKSIWPELYKISNLPQNSVTPCICVHPVIQNALLWPLGSRWGFLPLFNTHVCNASLFWHKMSTASSVPRQPQMGTASLVPPQPCSHML